MKIQALGQLNEHPDVPEWLTSVPISVPYFDGAALAFILDSVDQSDEQEITTAVESFLRLGPTDRVAASPYILKNYLRIAELADDEDLGCRIDSSSNVWNHVHPLEVFITRRQRRDRAIYVQITANCDWEREHGLQIIYRRGAELSRVSQFDGHLTHTDAFDLPEELDQIA